jgi:hypothetical protein
MSFATGIPGGLTMLATVPVDVAQYYYHVIVVAQKLAYVYGFSEFGMVDDNFKSLLTLLIGVMTDIDDADKTVMEIFSVDAAKNITGLTLGKAFNKTIVRIAIALSYRLTGKTIFKSIWKAIPFIGGLVSGGITLFTFRPMCDKLQERMHQSTKNLSKEIAINVIK